jgi:uncharacterized protein (DUF3820 family)
MDDDTIKRRVKAREQARILIALITEEATNITSDAIESFWDEIRQSLPPIDIQSTSNLPMTDEQARIFGLTLMPFGEFKGQAIRDVPMGRLEWYSDSQFQKQLVRYLNSPKIKQKRDLDDFAD